MLAQVLRRFDKRHKQFEDFLERHFGLVRPPRGRRRAVAERAGCSIGAYFTNEYSVEGAALFNPSLVLAPDQTGPGGRRATVRDEPARGRRRTHLVDRVSDRA